MTFGGQLSPRESYLRRLSIIAPGATEVPKDTFRECALPPEKSPKMELIWLPLQVFMGGEMPSSQVLYFASS